MKGIGMTNQIVDYLENSGIEIQDNNGQTPIKRALRLTECIA